MRIVQMMTKGDEYKKEDNIVLVGNKFPPLPKKHDRVSRGTIYKNFI